MRVKHVFFAAAVALSSALHAQSIQTDPFISAALAQVSADSIHNYISDLVTFHTRHNLSTQTDKKIGLGAAMTYLQKRCTEFASAAPANRPKPTIEIVRYSISKEKSRAGRELDLPNVMVTLPGTEAKGEIILLAHVDTRVNDNYDGETFAPGANDNGSGVSCLMEIVRVLSKLPLKQTIKCCFVSGEEHGLWGAGHIASLAKENKWPVLAVLNNDMIGNIEASETHLTSNNKVRVFSDSPNGEDSPSRQLARYMKEMAQKYIPHHEVKLIYRNDRYRRGGDHTPFLQAGFPAIRMSEYYENYDRTHQVVRQENGIKYGDLLESVDCPYVQRNTMVNMATAMSLALAPTAPEKARIQNANALSNYTILEWTPVLKADGQPDSAVHYEVLFRETDQSTWQVYQTCPAATTTERQKVKLPISKDNFFYAIRSVSEGGHASLPVVCR